MRRVVLVLLIAGGTLAAPSLHPRIVEFGRSWNSFLGAYVGCPEKFTRTEECRAGMARFDVRKWRKACEEARGLWGLRGSCQ